MRQKYTKYQFHPQDEPRTLLPNGLTTGRKTQQPVHTEIISHKTEANFDQQFANTNGVNIHPRAGQHIKTTEKNAECAYMHNEIQTVGNTFSKPNSAFDWLALRNASSCSYS
jgi:hypothetical protein